MASFESVADDVEVDLSTSHRAFRSLSPLEGMRGPVGVEPTEEEWNAILDAEEELPEINLEGFLGLEEPCKMGETSYGKSEVSGPDGDEDEPLESYDRPVSWPRNIQSNYTNACAGKVKEFIRYRSYMEAVRFMQKFAPNKYPEPKLRRVPSHHSEFPLRERELFRKSTPTQLAL